MFFSSQNVPSIFKSTTFHSGNPQNCSSAGKSCLLATITMATIIIKISTSDRLQKCLATEQKCNNKSGVLH